jgi:hypothetical protein
MSRTVKARDGARPLVWPAKDANEVIDYSIDFTDRLGDDTIASATFSLATSAGLTIDSQEDDGDKLATVTLSAGTAGSKGKILCRVVSTDGRTMDETVSLVIRAR